MELLSKKILWKSPYFLNQQISISSDGRVVVNNSKEMNIFTLDNSQNIQEIGSIRIESIDSKGSNENILQIDSASNEGELFSIPNIMGGVFIASLSWISISINRDEILSILFSNGILLFFQTCKDNFTLEIPSVAGNELFLVHTINMKVVVNVTAELSKLLSTTDASYLNGGISAFEWTISNCGRSFPMHKHLILVSGNHICALDVSINENMFTFELKTHFKCSNLPDMGICRRLQYFRDIEVSPSLGYLFLVLDKSLSRMKVIYENDGCMHLEVDKEWQCERINSIVVLDQNTVLVSIDMDIFLLSDQSGPRFVRLQRIHTSNIISLFSQIPVEKNNQLSVAELNFVSSSLGGEIFSWRITPLDEQKSDWAITEFQIHASGLLKSVGLACDPQGTTLVSLQCIPPRLLDSKLTQVNLHLSRPHLQLQVCANPLFESPKWVCAESDIVSLLKKIAPSISMSNQLVSLIWLSVLFSGSTTAALVNATYTLKTASNQVIRSRTDEQLAKSKLAAITISNYSSEMQKVLLSMKVVYLHCLLDNIVSAVFSILDDNYLSATQKFIGRVADRSALFVEISVKDEFSNLMKALGASTRLIDSLTAHGELILEPHYDKNIDPGIIMQSTWNLRVLHNLLHCRVSSVHDNIDGTWRRSTFHELLSHRIRKVIHRNIAIVTLERFEQDHLEKDLLPTEHVALSRIRGVLLESTSVDDRSARTYYAERVHHLLGGSSSSSTATKKARRCDDQESLESCLNCGKLGVPFDLSNPFVSACTHCNSLHDRCCLTLRLVSFDLPVLRCQMCSSVCLPDQSESQIFCDLWTTSGSGSMCPFCLVLMDSILC